MSGNNQRFQVPLIGQDQAIQQAAVQQLGLTMYTQLIPPLAVFRLEHGYPGGEDAKLNRIAQEATEIVDAALARIGIARAAQPPI